MQSDSLHRDDHQHYIGLLVLEIDTVTVYTFYLAIRSLRKHDRGDLRKGLHGHVGQEACPTEQRLHL